MVFFHLFDDEILEMYHAKKKLGLENLLAILQKDLYLLLAILPADEVVVISPTFLFENELCEKILSNNMELLRECLVTVFMKESNLEEFYSKKQERYVRVKKYSKYERAYYTNRIKSLIYMPFANEIKTVSIGTTSFSICLELLKKEKDMNHIPDQLYNDIIHRLQETETTSFLWESVCEQLASAKVPEHVIRKLKIRAIMTQSYMEAYQTEGIALVQDNLLCPSIRPSTKTRAYDLLKIERVLSALEIRVSLLTMPCKKFCELKKNADYILIMREVHNLIQANLPTEEIVCHIKEKGLDRQLHNILKGKRKEEKALVDVLIMIATINEENTIIEKGGWRQKTLLSGQIYFLYEKNGVRFALARGYGMGESDAAIMAQMFIEHLKPKVIAMAGFCAGKLGAVHLGDIIVANKVYNYDIGKQISETDVLPEISNYSLKGNWLHFIERFDKNWIKNIDAESPVDFQWQQRELLGALLENSPQTKDNLYSRDTYPNWSEVIDELDKKKYIFIDEMKPFIGLTDQGRKYINGYKIRNAENYKPELKLHIAPIATGARVQLWENVFNILETKHDRKTCALDMESHVIGKLGDYNEIPFLVVKGVGDFASGNKAFANRFIEFTSYASCKFIIDLFSSTEFNPYWNS